MVWVVLLIVAIVIGTSIGRAEKRADVEKRRRQVLDPVQVAVQAMARHGAQAAVVVCTPMRAQKIREVAEGVRPHEYGFTMKLGALELLVHDNALESLSDLRVLGADDWERLRIKVDAWRRWGVPATTVSP
jgi:hypothetical protein